MSVSITSPCGGRDFAIIDVFSYCVDYETINVNNKYSVLTGKLKCINLIYYVQLCQMWVFLYIHDTRSNNYCRY